MKKFIFIFMFLMIIVMITTSINVIGVLNGSDSILKTNNSPTISSTVEPTSPQTNSSIIGKNRYTVVLDTGHGGKTPGPIGPKGTLEKDVALAVMLKVGKILEKKDFNVIYIRKDYSV
ncbi:N-acetylmuramoyl-L-alanine amidase AmiC precursor [Clostridium homopropionicum DSM 5847]|uniref:N-acetylmuramoyl-L-alanine amidase AmiC n=1 Tax=Clostridium homopropionicum DSM 5847 TaxID=1121318 RepID=A0A0L6ZBQ4_9CLOT|nr:N-acetylmuramoyl-L-alanine amidase [Clostridium homopropionicum]KOA20392.1 N-acetylmuramoyl-L-alanine amidase AmiC precursor [Clostridium homopropionicum DSM 5847]SFG74990.1 N-acetylmuramoyl-L-alanine amidase [Clostridium homopropionicum]